jgi:hypothetical protein
MYVIHTCTEREREREREKSYLYAYVCLVPVSRFHVLPSKLDTKRI